MTALYEKLVKAKKAIEALLSDSPSYQLWRSIEVQINFILSDFSSSGVFLKKTNTGRVNQIILGLQAIREIETSHSEFADLLCQIDCEYKELYR